MRKLKITHIGKFFPPEHGGIESVTAALAYDHSSQGHDVNVICFTNGVSEDVTTGSLTILRRKVFGVFSSQPVGFKYFLEVMKYSRSADIVHIHAPNLMAGLAAMLLPKKVKLLVHWHADISGKGFIGLLVRPIERIMQQRADTIVCTTQAYADSSKTLESFKAKIRIIPIGIPEVELHNDQDGALEKSLEWVGSRPIILVVGRLVPYKGLFTLLKAISKMEAKAAVAVVGVGPLQSDLLKEIDRLNLCESVCLLGRQNEDNLARLFAKSDVFCLPSINRAEAFGVVLLEAMRAGLPIVATNIRGSGVNWVNKQGVSGENVTPGDADQLANILDKFLLDSDLALKYGRQARSLYESTFTQGKMTDSFLKTYHDLHLGKKS